MRKLSRLAGLRKLPKLIQYKIGRNGIWTQAHRSTLSIQGSPFIRDWFFRANPEQVDGQGIRLTKCRKMSTHLSLSKLLSRKYAVIVHLIHPNTTQCSSEAYSKATCVEIVTLLGGSLVKTFTKEKWQTNRCSGLLASSPCGNSVAPGKETEHLGKCAEPLRSGGNMKAVLTENLCPLCLWIVTKLLPGETVIHTRESAGQRWMDSSLKFSGLPSTQARSANV